MFICRIKIRCTQDQNSHLAHGTMPDSRRNQNGMLWCYRDLFSVQNDGSIRLASQNDVNFSMLLVVMLACIGADFSQMYRARKLVLVSKSPAGDATRTGDPRQGSQIDNFWLGWQGQALPRGEWPMWSKFAGSMRREADRNPYVFHVSSTVFTR